MNHSRKARWALLALSGTFVSFLDVPTQTSRSEVFWAVRALLPEALVNSSDVFAQISMCKQFWAVRTFLPDALVNLFDVVI